MAEQATIDKLVEAYNAHDVDAIAELYSDDAVIERSGLKEPLRGKDGIRVRAGMFFEAFPDFRVEVLEELEEGNVKAAVIRTLGTHRGNFKLGGRNVPPSGNRLDNEAAAFTTLNDEGLIVRDKLVFDTATVARQLGVAAEGQAATTRT